MTAETIPASETISAPLTFGPVIVKPEWIDYNGHMNVAYYVLVFDGITDDLLEYLRLTRNYKALSNSTTFVGDMNVTYRQEVKEGDQLSFTTRILDCDEKSIHFWHEMYHAKEGFLAATNELLSLHIDLEARKVCPMPDDIQDWVRAVRDAHVGLPIPPGIGRSLGIRRKSQG